MIKYINYHEKYMEIAMSQARKAYHLDEVPVGAIIVRNDEIIAKSCNMTISKNDSTAHAEIEAIKKACKYVKNHRITNTTIYVTLEPCAMCYGAIIQSRIDLIVFGAYDKNTGVCGSCSNLTESRCFNHKPKLVGGILENECSNLLRTFFKERRN